MRPSQRPTTRSRHARAYRTRWEAFDAAGQYETGRDHSAALAVAFVAARTKAFDPAIQRAFAEIGHAAMSNDSSTLVLKGVFAGWLKALMVWLLPFAESARIWVIIVITYVVGLGHFSHIIAGAVETFTLAAMGQAGWSNVLTGYIAPTLLGNILGGTTLVATLNHAQVVAGKASAHEAVHGAA
jgi:formate/nitrite transporter FocA (FNT family)